MMAQGVHPRGRSLEDLLGPLLPGPWPGLEVSGLAQDSRRVRPGDLFLAVNGARGHGLAHWPEALRRGAVGVLWDPQGWAGPPPEGAWARPVPELRRHVGRIAARFYDDPSRRLRVVGVTGTDGKSSVSTFLAQAMHAQTAPFGVIGTLGAGFPGRMRATRHTTPDAIHLQALLAAFAQQRARGVAMEVSSHALDQDRVAGVAFEVAVLTNITRDHLDYHGDLERYARAKARLFEMADLRHAVFNLDDPRGQSWARRLTGRLAVTGVAFGAPPALGIPCVGVEAEPLPGGLRLGLHSAGRRLGLDLPLLGRFNAQNAGLVFAVLLALGLDADEAARRLQALRPVPGRMEPFRAPGRPLAVVDYAHTPAALEQALRALRAHVSGRIFCVFGCGGSRDRGKRPLMGAVAERLADRVILADDNPRDERPEAIVREILAGTRHPEAVQVIHDRAQAIATALELAGPGDAVLVAGKGHEGTQDFGAEVVRFSDREAVAALLHEVGP